MLSCCRIFTALAFNQRKPETAPALRKRGWVKTIRIRYMNTRIFFVENGEKVRTRPQWNEDEPSGSWIRNKYIQVHQTVQKRKKRDSRRRFFKLSMWGSNSPISRRRGSVPAKKCTKTCTALDKVVVLLSQAHCIFDVCVAVNVVDILISLIASFPPHRRHWGVS